MKQLFLFLVFLSPLTLFGKDSTTVKDGRFFIAVKFSPDYCYRTLTKNEESISNNQWTSIKKALDSMDVPKFGYTTGFNFGFQINKRLSVESGIQYSNKGYKRIPQLIKYALGVSPEMATQIENYTYLDIPLIVNYSFLKNKFQIIIGAGMVLNVFQRSFTRQIPENPSPDFKDNVYENTFDYNKVNFSPTVSIGLNYKISNRIILQTEPSFRYGLQSTLDNLVGNVHLWSVGLNFGFYIRL